MENSLPRPAGSPSADKPDVVRDWTEPDESAGQNAEHVLGQRRTGKFPLVWAVRDGDRLVLKSAEFASRAGAEAKLQRLQQRPSLLAVELDDKPVQALVDPPRSADPYRPHLWGLDRLKAETVWQQATGAGVTVAILDTGVAVHPDLAGSFVPGTDVSGGNGNGRNDGHGHGTHVAGTIAATPDNNLGVTGVAPRVSIMPVKVLDDSGSGTMSAVAQGAVWAADHGADVVNLSLGGPVSSSVLETAIAYAKSKGVSIVAAAGNSRTDGRSPVNYPAASPGVTAVAAVDSAGKFADFSNGGSYVDLAAPGVGIWSTVPNGGYASYDGTSMATPHVAAVVALLKQYQRDHGSSYDADLLLAQSAADLGSAGWDPDYGYGVVDPLSAIAAAGGQLPKSPAAPHTVRAEAVGAWGLKASWQAPDVDDDHGRPVEYVATASPGGHTCRAVAPVTTCDFRQTNPQTTFTVSVVARNPAGESVASAPSNSATTSQRVDRAGDWAQPVAVPASGVVSDYIDYREDHDLWSFVPPASGRYRVTLDDMDDDYGYLVGVFGATPYDFVDVVGYWGPNADSFVTVNLRAGQRYHLSVSNTGDFPGLKPAMWSETDSYRVSVVSVDGSPAVPLAPRDVQVQLPEAGRAVLSWRKPTIAEMGDSAVWRYEARARSQQTGEDWRCDVFVPSWWADTTCTIWFDPDQTYEYSVVFHNQNGAGAAGFPAVVPPPPPRPPSSQSKEPVEESDWWFATESAGRYKVGLSGLKRDYGMHFTLRDRKGRVIAKSAGYGNDEILTRKLKAKTLYRVRVHGTDLLGADRYRLKAVNVDKLGKAPRAPKGVKVRLQGTTAVVTWKRLSVFDIGDTPLKRYVAQAGGRRCVAKPTRNQCVITGLSSKRRDVVTVRAVNRDGAGPVARKAR